MVLIWIFLMDQNSGETKTGSERTPWDEARQQPRQASS